MNALPIKMRHKGLLFVLVPFILQLVLLVIVASYLRDYQTIIDQQLRYKDIPRELQDLSAALAECAVFAKLEKPDQEEFEHRKKVVEAKLKELRNLCSRDPQEKKKFDEIDGPVQADLKQLSQPGAAAQSDNMAESSFASEASALSGDALGSAFDPLDLMLTTELANFEGHELSLPQQLRLRQQALILLAVSFVISAALMYLYFRTVVKRFGILQKNIRRLSDREPLHSPIPGNDEISEMDKVLHSLAFEIQNSDQQKRQLLSLVRQGMREHIPLNNAYQILHKLNEQDEEAQHGLALRQKLLQVERQTDGILKTVSTLLDIQAIEAGNFEMLPTTASAAEIIDAALSSADEYAASRGVQIKFAPPAVKIHGDAGRLSQVMGHLLHNAVKNSPQGGTVVVDVIEEQRFVEFRVTDESYDSATMTQSKLIEDLKFGQGDTLSHGTGMLGLAMCKAIVEQHGGTLGVESSEQDGTSVFFHLPRAVE